MLTAAVVLTGHYLCSCGRIVHAGSWAALQVDGQVWCHYCGPAAWVDR